MLKNIKLASIYIGAIIGAGFASGREIVIFFYKTNFVSLIIAAILLTLLYILFLKIPKIDNIVFDILVIFAMSMSFVLMVSALNDLENKINMKNLCLIISILCCFISSFNFEKIKIINTLSILLIIIMLIILSSKCSYTHFENVNFYTAITYVGMNILLGGVVINGQNKNMKNKDILISAIFVFIIFSTLFFMIYKIAMIEHLSSLPIISFAQKHSYINLSAIVLILAIFTTLISSAHILFIKLNKYIDNMLCATSLIMLVFLSYKTPFYSLSEIMYPILGYMGCIYIIFSIFLTLKKEFSFNNFAKCFNAKIHNSSHYTK